MTPKEIAQAVMAWADATLPELKAAYDHAVEGKAGFPDAGVEIGEWIHADKPPADQRLPFEQSTAQVGSRTASIALLIVVDAELPGQQAADKLYEYANALAAAAMADKTLGGRVTRIARNFSFNFHPDAPFLEFDDGSRGRRMTMSLVVSDPTTPK